MSLVPHRPLHTTIGRIAAATLIIIIAHYRRIVHGVVQGLRLFVSCVLLHLLACVRALGEEYVYRRNRIWFRQQILSELRAASNPIARRHDRYVTYVPVAIDRALMVIAVDELISHQLSFIVLNQIQDENGNDVLFKLLDLHRYFHRIYAVGRHCPASERRAAADAMKLIESKVWPQVMRLLGEPGMDSGGSGYDVMRTDRYGRTALHYAFDLPVSKGSTVYRVVERLLQLGANVDALDRYGKTPVMYYIRWGMHQQLSNLALIQLLLDYGGESHINHQVEGGMTLIHLVVAYAEIDLLREMYERLPHHMSAIDYTLTSDDICDCPPQTLIQLASLCATGEYEYVHEPERYQEILDLLLSEREKQYGVIRSLLHRHTPLKCNNMTDLSTIVFSYIAAADYHCATGHG